MKRAFYALHGLVAGCLLGVSLSVLAAPSVDTSQIIEAQNFLEQYRVASQAQSADFFNLYSDRAIIHTRVEGSAAIAFQGITYKAWGRTLLQAHRVGIDASEFHEATVEQRGPRLLIKAKRYSVARCYWDPNYQVGLEREESSFRIIEERLVTQPKARCEASGLSPSPESKVMENPYLHNGLGGNDRTMWRPMSQDEIAKTAFRIAQEAASKYSIQHRGDATVIPAVTAMASRPVTGGLSEPEDPLWLTPN